MFGNQLVRVEHGGLVRAFNLPWALDERRWRAAQAIMSSPDGHRVAFNETAALTSRSVVLDVAAPEIRLELPRRIYAVLADDGVVVSRSPDALEVLTLQGRPVSRVQLPRRRGASSGLEVLAAPLRNRFAAWDSASGDLALHDTNSGTTIIGRETPTGDGRELGTSARSSESDEPPRSEANEGGSIGMKAAVGAPRAD